MTPARCEYCETTATRRVKKRRPRWGTYLRFSCPKHHDKVDRLVSLDITGRRETMINPTGFDATTGRMLGPSSPCASNTGASQAPGKDGER